MIITEKLGTYLIFYPYWVKFVLFIAGGSIWISKFRVFTVGFVLGLSTLLGLFVFSYFRFQATVSPLKNGPLKFVFFLLQTCSDNQKMCMWFPYIYGNVGPVDVFIFSKTYMGVFFWVSLDLVIRNSSLSSVLKFEDDQWNFQGSYVCLSVQKFFRFGIWTFSFGPFSREGPVMTTFEF